MKEPPVTENTKETKTAGFILPYLKDAKSFSVTTYKLGKDINGYEKKWVTTFK
jgi:hypothetical protein